MNKIKTLFATVMVAILASTSYASITTQEVVKAVQESVQVQPTFLEATLNSSVLDFTSGYSKPVGEDSTPINSFGINTAAPLFKDFKFQLGGDLTIREDGNQYDSTFGPYVKREKYSLAALVDYRHTAYGNDLFALRPIVGYNLNHKISLYGVGHIHMNTDTSGGINEEMVDRGELHITYLTDNAFLLDGSVGYLFGDVTSTAYGLAGSKSFRLFDVFTGGEIDNAGNYIVNCGVAVGFGENYARHSTVYNANPNSPFPKYSAPSLITYTDTKGKSGSNPPPPPNLVTICYNGETIQILAKDLRKYLKNGAKLGSCDEPPPPPHEVTICYRGETITILSTQLAWYLAHGATLGTCQVEPPPGGDRKVTLCHHGRTIRVGLRAARGHLAHGDSLGRCEE
jgi:hypothetical protein